MPAIIIGERHVGILGTMRARMTGLKAGLLAVGLCGVAGCGGNGSAEPAGRAPWILLVTLDTTRADVIGPEVTPAFEALARQGRRFTQAHATVPETLPSHASMLTGLYPAGHGVHENGRFLSPQVPVLAEALGARGYRTGAVVSTFVLARRFGLARGFDVFADVLPDGAVERTADEATSAAIELLEASGSDAPVFLWTHYFDAHTPYTPAPAFAARFPGDPYRGEVAQADAAMGRLVDRFRAAAAAAGRDVAILVAADHGEGLGDHGEDQHGHLVYQSTMHVPLVVAGPGVTPGEVGTPVSTRRVFHTVLDWAGEGSRDSLRADSVTSEVVIGEAMKPFLQYGWQPQIMAVEGRTKAILAGRIEVYDLEADPGERRDLRTGATLSPGLRTALDDYPVPSLDAAPEPVDAAALEKLASLGYVGASSAPVVRRDAPRPADMVTVLPLLERASGLFTAGRYQEAVPVLREILAADPNHLDATLRLATAYSALGRTAEADAAFRRAATLAPESLDVALYAALHDARTPRWQAAIPRLEAVLARHPERVAALEALVDLYGREGRLDDRLHAARRLFALRPATGPEALGLGRALMQAQRTNDAIWAFEQALAAQGQGFEAALDLGVLYQAAGRLDDAARMLDRVGSTGPEYPMALFKRAQIAVLRREADSAARIAAARRFANATTRPLIERERLFR